MPQRVTKHGGAPDGAIGPGTLREEGGKALVGGVAHRSKHQPRDAGSLRRLDHGLRLQIDHPGRGLAAATGPQPALLRGREHEAPRGDDRCPLGPDRGRGVLSRVRLGPVARAAPLTHHLAGHDELPGRKAGRKPTGHTDQQEPAHRDRVEKRRDALPGVLGTITGDQNGDGPAGEPPQRHGAPDPTTSTLRHGPERSLGPALQAAEDLGRLLRKGGQDGRNRRGPVQPARFHFTMRYMSAGFFRIPMTTEASKPECILQFWHSGSRRDSQ